MSSYYISAIYHNYSRNFPKHIPSKALHGFLISTALGLLARNPMNLTLLSGAMAATATIVEAVTRPIIRSLLPNHSTIAGIIQFSIPTLITLGLASAVSPWTAVVYYPTYFFIPDIVSFALNSNFYNRNVAVVHIF